MSGFPSCYVVGAPSAVAPASARVAPKRWRRRSACPCRWLRARWRLGRSARRACSARIAAADQLNGQHPRGRGPGSSRSRRPTSRTAARLATTPAKIAAGTGLSDVVAIEEGRLSTIREVSDAFVDLRDYGIEDNKDNWLDWKYAQGTDGDGRVFGAGLDIGPQGLCFRGDLFEAAGLPGDREGFAEAIGGEDATWESFFEFGQKYTAATGKAFYHNPSFFWNSFVNQQDEGYYKADGEHAERQGQQGAAGPARPHRRERQHRRRPSPGWGVGDQAKADDFAVYTCPAWMLGVVSGYYDAGTTGTGWDFADVLPGGAANWGGAFLGVSESPEHKEAAADLALGSPPPPSRLPPSKLPARSPRPSRARSSSVTR